MGYTWIYYINYPRKHLRVGETFSLYLIWYSIGRFFVEGLRTDSLMLTSHIRVAQLVSVILMIMGIILIIYRRIKHQPVIYKNAGPLTEFKSEGKIMRRLTIINTQSMNPLWRIYQFVRFSKVLKNTVIIEISRFIPF